MADDVVQVKITAQTSDLTAGLKQAADTAKSTFDTLKTSADQAKQSFEAMGVGAAATNPAIASMGTTATQATAALGKISTGAGGFAAIANAANSARMPLSTLTNEVRALADEFASGRIHQAAGTLLRTMTTLWEMSPVTMGWVAGVAAAGGALVALQHELDSARDHMVELGASSAVGGLKATDLELEQLTRRYKEFSGASDASATEVIGNFAKIRGMSVPQIEALSAAVNAFAFATGKEAPAAAKALGESFGDVLHHGQALLNIIPNLTEAQRQQFQASVAAGDAIGAQNALYQDFAKWMEEVITKSRDEYTAHSQVAGILPTLSQLITGASQADSAFAGTIAQVTAQANASIGALQGYASAVRNVEAALGSLGGALSATYTKIGGLGGALHTAGAAAEQEWQTMLPALVKGGEKIYQATEDQNYRIAEKGSAERRAVRQEEYRHAAALYGAGSAEAIRAETAWLEEVKRDEQGKTKARAGGAGAAKAIAADQHGTIVANIDAEEQKVREAADLSQITRAQELTQLLALEEKRKQLLIEHVGNVKDAEAKIQEITAQSADRQAKIQHEMANKEQKDYSSITSSLSSDLAGMIMGQRKAADVLKSIMSSLLQHVIEGRLKQVAGWITGDAMMTTSSVAAAAAQKAAVVGGATAQAGVRATSMISSILGSAQETFAGIFGFLSPVMGPMAAAPAATGMATVAAAATRVPFATGAYSIARDTPADLHAGEMVIPKTFADSIRGVMDGSGGGGPAGGVTHVWDFSGATILDKSGLVKMISDHMNRNPTLRPGY